MAKKVKQNNFEIKCLDDVKAKKYSDGTFESIIDHTKKVINVAKALMKRYCFKDSIFRINYQKIYETLVMTTCVLHDVGKFDENFQKYIHSEQHDNDSEEYIRHNIISYNIVKLYLSSDKICNIDPQNLIDIVAKNVLYHHIPYKNYNGEEKYNLNLINEFYNICQEYIGDIKLMKISDSASDFDVRDNKYLEEPLFDKILSYNEKDLEPWTRKSVLASISKIVGGILVSADRLVSSDIENGDKYLNNDIDFINEICKKNDILDISLKENIDYSFECYDKVRLGKQLGLVEKIINDNEHTTHIISASAGCGKTLIGLLYQIRTNKKLLWVVPTINLAEATYKNILEELENLKLKGLTVGLMYGGVMQNEKDINECDIIVVVIDTFLSFHSKNNFRSFLLDAYDMDIIFDEFHEFICGEGLFGLFNQIMFTRVNFCNSRTLLLSATAKDLSMFWYGNSNVKIWNKELPIQGENVRIHINFINACEFPQKNAIYYMGTLHDTQVKYLNFKKYEECYLLHAYFNDNEKKEKYDYIFKNYGVKNENDKLKLPLITTTMLGVGWNITVQSIYDVIISPDSTIQKCGRLSRKNEYTDVYYYICEPENKSSFNKLISHIYNNDLNRNWRELLRKYDGKVITKGELYKLYENFYQENKDTYKKYLCDLYYAANNSLLEIKLKKGNLKSNKKYIPSDMTYRGINNSYYVTVENNGGYIEPMSVSDYFFNSIYDTEKIRSENFNDTINKDKRYNFMIKYSNTNNSQFNFPNKIELKSYYGITKNNMSFENCKKMAKNSDSPLLLCDFEYDELGLHHKNLKL